MSRSRLRVELLCAVWALATPAFAAEDELFRACRADCAEGVRLQLEVYRNGQPTHLIVPFLARPDGGFSAAAADLRALGLVAPSDKTEIPLEQLPGVSYHFDEASQRMFLVAAPRAIALQRISLNPQPTPAVVSHDTGALLNYGVGVQAGGAPGAGLRGQAVTGDFEARLFGRFGLIDSGFTGEAGPPGSRGVRLDSYWTWSDPSHAITARAGDLISGGFFWTRPLRLGGVQLRRDFGVRPDLITIPTPVLSATAAAPSTLDVMLGQSVVMSRQIGPGPIEITDLPVTQGQGTASLILRDVNGNSQRISTPYFATPDLLREGLMDFSLEAGYARRNFGLLSNDYDGALVGSASARWGATDSITLQSHLEGGAGLTQAGGGLVARTGDFGALSLAIAASRYADEARMKTGMLAAVAFQTRVSAITLSAQAQKTFGDYEDLAAVTANRRWRLQQPDQTAVPTLLVQLAASTPINIAALKRWGDTPSFSLTYGRTVTSGVTRAVAGGALRWTYANKVSFQASVYAAGSDRAESGFFLSVSLPFGAHGSATSGVQRSGGETTGYVEAREQEQLTPGSTAWDVRVDAGRETQIQAAGVYRSDVGRISAQASYASDGATEASARIDGAVVWLDGPAWARDRIDGAFAVAEVGAPHIEVMLQNRSVGQSDAHGRLLLPNLNPYEPNRVGVNMNTVALADTADVDTMLVSPPYGAGARARFGVKKAPPHSLITVRMKNGRPAPAGVTARLNDDPEEFVVGYDGQLFLTNLHAANDIHLDLGDGDHCTAHFLFDLNVEVHPHGPDVVCH